MIIIYPNVPNAPGVPPLRRNPLAPAPRPPTFMTSDGPGVSGGAASTQWGIYKDGARLVAADSVLALDFNQNWSLSDYPVEPNGFATYDKVNSPFDVTLRLACGGSVQKRQQFLDAVDKVSDSTDLVDIVMPEKTYKSCNVEKTGFSRKSNDGNGLLMIDVRALEIRVTATETFSNTKAPSGADAKSDGTVQTTAAKPAQAQSGLSSIVNGGG